MGRTVTLTIELAGRTERLLAERAGQEGKTAEMLASELFEQAIAPGRTFDEILAPFRKEFAESGMTEEEWDALIEEAREEVWQEQQARKKQ